MLCLIWEPPYSFSLLENADLYSVESLKYLANEIPFQKDTDWSVDAAILQDRMIENGKVMAYLQSIHKCFKRLRIIDKHVCINTFLSV